jgi:hypothetical protein
LRFFLSAKLSSKLSSPPVLVDPKLVHALLIGPVHRGKLGVLCVGVELGHLGPEAVRVRVAELDVGRALLVVRIGLLAAEDLAQLGEAARSHGRPVPVASVGAVPVHHGKDGGADQRVQFNRATWNLLCRRPGANNVMLKLYLFDS